MSVTVADCLKLPALRRAELVAGAQGRDRAVGAITVLEYPKIDLLSGELLIGNELVISALVSIKDDVEMQCRLIRHLNAMGEAGFILYYSGVFVKEVAPELIETANELDFPLILMPRGRMDFRYNESITEVMELVIADRERESYYVSEMVNLISRLSPQLRTMNNILRLLSDRLHCTLVLTDRALSRKASAAWPLANEWDYPLILGLVNELQPGQRSGAAVELDDRSVWVWDFPVKGRRSQGLHLLALDESGTQKGSQLEQAAEVVGLFLNVWNRDANFEGTDALVHAILSDRPEEMRRLASRMGIDVSTIHSLLVLRLRDAGGELLADSALQYAVDRFKSLLLEHHKLVIADVYNHGVVALCDDKVFDERESDVAAAFLSRESDEGISGECAVMERIENTAQARAAYTLVEENLAHARRIWPEKRVFSRSDLSFARDCRATLESGEAAAQEKLACLGAILESPDAESNMRILCTYLLDAGGSTLRTGELLYLHRNTVKYHIGKLRAVLGDGLDAMPGSLQVYTAAALYRLMQSDAR